jgi:putative hydrolase of the HAD superfamily
MTTPPRPEAVLLDVGGVFHLPGHDEISAAYRAQGHEIDRARLNYAHYAGAARFHTAFETRGTDTESDHTIWLEYLDAHADALGVGDDVRADLLPQLGKAFIGLETWSHQIEGSVEGAEALKAAGVRIGIVSNADGTVAAVLEASGTAQVGPGPGVEVEVIIDSGAVGVAKPDPRIFHLALDAMGLDPATTWYVGDMPTFDVVGARAAGLFPILMDPHDFHGGIDALRVTSLFEVAELVRVARG